jgi:hypothetical protein
MKSVPYIPPSSSSSSSFLFAPDENALTLWKRIQEGSVTDRYAGVESFEPSTNFVLPFHSFRLRTGVNQTQECKITDNIEIQGQPSEIPEVGLFWSLFSVFLNFNYSSSDCFKHCYGFR